MVCRSGTPRFVSARTVSRHLRRYRSIDQRASCDGSSSPSCETTFGNGEMIMRNRRGVSGIGGAILAALLTVGTTAAMQAQTSRNDGIKVHGHWTIDIVNPDGKLASHNEFENALEATGTNALSGVLARTFAPAAWRLHSMGAGGTGPC